MLSPMEEDRDALIGRVLAQKIEIKRRLGSGGMGQVYLGHHRGLDKAVAVKVLNDASDLTNSARFQREARAASRLDHPNAVRVLDFGEDGPDRLQYIVMERLEGTDLKEILQTRGKLSGREVVDLMIPVASVLAAAHAQGFVHRDIKPANIMLHRAREPDGSVSTVVKVLDFGLAKAGHGPPEELLDVESVSVSLSDEATAVGGIVGTPAYMSPEQFRGDPLDGRSDIFSVGVVMYGALTGKRPYRATSMNELKAQRQSYTPRSPIELDPAIDPRLAAIVMRAMALDPRDRFSSALELRAALLELVDLSGPTNLAPKVEITAEDREAPAFSATRSVLATSPRSARLVVGFAVLSVALIAVAIWVGREATAPVELVAAPSTAPVEAVPSPTSTSSRAADGPAASPPSPALARINLRVEGPPKGTEVYGAGGLLGTAPGTIQLEASDAPVVLTFKAPGRRSASREIVPAADQELIVKLELAPQGPQPPAPSRDRLENPFR